LSDLDTVIAECLPSGWNLTHLIFLDPDWQVNLCDGEHVVVATGASPGLAFAAAYAKSFDPAQYTGRLFINYALAAAEVKAPSLSSLLNFRRKLSEPINRRI
jgi:hypothetical protein